MPERKSNLLIPVVGATVLLAGSVATYLYFQGPSGDSSGALGSAKLVPATAVMATYITTDSQAWEKLEEFGTPEAQKIVAEGLAAFQEDVFSEGNISYEQDLKPWIGGVMLAIIPPNPTTVAQSNQAKQSKTGVLMVVGIKDKVKALSFANKLKAEKEITVEESDYKGETITAVTQNGRQTYSAILNNDYLVLSGEKLAVENAIETFQGEPSFASQEGRNKILTANADMKNILAQVYIPDYADMMEKLVAASPQNRQLPPQTLQQFKQVKSLVARVGVDDQGVRMRAIANLDPELNKLEYQPTPAKIIGQLPLDTLGMISGNNISRSWSAIVEQSQDDPQFNQILQLLRGQLNFVDIDLEQDVFGWMDQEFAFATIPSNPGILPNLGVGGALLLGTSDRQTASATLTKLDNLAKTQQINVTKTKIDGKDVTEWQLRGQRALLSHGWLNQDTLFLAVGGSVAEAIATNNTPKLDSSDTFKTVTGSLPQSNAGYFYIDVAKTTSLINSVAPQGKPLPPELNTVLNSIHGFGVTATSPDKFTTELEMLLALKPKTAE
ncbi:DUF3352 domain-containing protein [Nodularia harveyana UHCC-0300]|uniref:DUF3352 domain-containing protein n=1 Tax=Nodularia harveyana UHCC-0300 TaxID=2974287 RepID=A0ABU5UHZ1_9CYAN|nr:DUF3352 domain-containing protein [Nodularia harveyana]MEA5583177.1 DUF3352 domain-containing protein [Nodularia harveyana UHCC-0300]